METLPHINKVQITEIRQQMLKFAVLQLNDPDLAEEVVQEAFVSAYKNAHSFKGKSALKTWIFAILKYKIIDAINQRKRLVSVSELLENKAQHPFFDHTGYWILETYDPKEWEDVSHLTYKEEFWTIFDLCLNNLPSQQARIFMMREHLELSTAQICQECEISISNLHVILHRARLQLQACLSKHWFGEH